MKKSSFKAALLIAAACATSLALAPMAMAQDGACATTTQVLAPGNTLGIDTSMGGLTDTYAQTCSGGGGDGSDIWVQLTGLNPGNIYELETLATGTVTDTSFEIFDSCGGTAIECDDDGGDGFMSLASFTAAGATYYVVVNSDWGDPDGTFSLSLTDLGAPSGDSLCASTSQTLTPGNTLTIDTTGASNAAAPGCSGSGGTDAGDIWVALNGLTPGNLYSLETFDIGDIADTSIEVFASCGGMSLGCNDDKDGGAGDYMSLMTFTASATTHYALTNPDWSEPDGTYDLELTDLGVAPTLETAADTCADVAANPFAEVTGSDLPFVTYYDGFTTRTDTGDWRGAAVTGGGTGGVDSWWSFTPDTTGLYTISLGYDDLSAALSMWTSDNMATPCAGVFTEFGDSGFANPPARVERTEMLTAGTTYFIIYEDAFAGSAPGNFDISIEQYVFPMDCATAPSIDPGALPVTVNADNTNSSPTHAFGGVFTGNDDFYTFAPTSDGVYSVAVSGADSDPFVYESSSLCADLEAVLGEFLDFAAAEAAGLISSGGLIGDETIRFRATSGNDYYIVIDDFDGTLFGAYSMTVDSVGPLVAQDECSDALQLTSGVQETASTTGAVNDVYFADAFGDYAIGPDLFYRFSATMNGNLDIVVDPTTSGFDASVLVLVDDCVNLAFFTGSFATSFVDNVGPQARGVETISVPVLNGDDVLIMVSSPDASEGAFTITATQTAGVHDWSMLE